MSLQTERVRAASFFYDESVQKILREVGVLDLFTDYVKYPRTHHLPWSKCIHSDDKVIKDMSFFSGKRVIVTEKMDGENTTMYRDYIHAISVDGVSHPSRDWVKNFWSTFAHEIPRGWRVAGENMYAVHSIEYSALESYFYGFSVWNDRNECLSWDETLEWFQLLGIKPAPVLYDGIYSQSDIEGLYDEKKDWARSEGYVLRVADQYSYADFKRCVAKYVRRDHIRQPSIGCAGGRFVQMEYQSEKNPYRV